MYFIKTQYSCFGNVCIMSTKVQQKGKHSERVVHFKIKLLFASCAECVYFNNLSHSFFFVVVDLSLLYLGTYLFTHHICCGKHFTLLLTLLDIIILRRYYISPFPTLSLQPILEIRFPHLKCDRSAINLVKTSSHSEPIHTVNPVNPTSSPCMCVCVCVCVVRCVCVCVSHFLRFLSSNKIIFAAAMNQMFSSLFSLLSLLVQPTHISFPLIHARTFSRLSTSRNPTIILP